MKIKGKLVVMGLCMMIAIPTLAKNENMVVNGNKVTIEVYEENGTKLIPLRKVGELLGLTTNYYSDTNSIRLIRSFYSPAEIGLDAITEIQLIIGSKKGVAVDYPKDKILELPIAPKIINGVTYVPLRTIAETMDFPINYKDGMVYLGKEIANNNGFVTLENGTKLYNPDNLKDAKSYYVYAQSFVESCLKDPKTAEFEPAGTPMVFLTEDNSIMISGKIRATNSYGAYVTSYYDVIFYNGDWTQYAIYIDHELIATNQ